MENKYRISFSGTENVPETVKLYNFGVEIPIYNNSLKMAVACKDFEKAIQLAKKEIRKDNKKDYAYTIGMIDNDHINYMSSLYTFDKYDIDFLLMIYKIIKNKVAGKPTLLKLKERE